MVYKYFIDKDVITGVFVKEEDYLKVVEDKEKLEYLYKKNINYYINENKRLYKELKEKDGEIERLEKELENKLEPVEELWTLKYIYDVEGVVKEYEQNGMLKEDAEELIGMDSDNWNHFSLTKEERPDKDKIIEELLLRCESNEELLKELEERDRIQKEIIIELQNKIHRKYEKEY